jgi:hypothetical protein
MAMTALQRRVLRLEARLGMAVPEPWERLGWETMSDAEQLRVVEDYVAAYPHSHMAQQLRALEALTDAELEALVAEADDAFIQRVGVIKVEERIAFADAFALALAERLNIPLVTTAHYEFDAVERKGHVRFMWLREFLRITGAHLV